MSLCPYKWFLYMASLWAVAYVMLEAFMQYRVMHQTLQKPNLESCFETSDSDSEDDDEGDTVPESDDENDQEEADNAQFTNVLAKSRNQPVLTATAALVRR